jgi:hypothetical protein
MLRTFPIVLAVLIILSVGVVHGLWTDRWALSDEPQASASKLPDVPLVVGEWQGTAQEMDPGSFAIADIAGYLMRRYTNPRTGVTLSLLVVCGRPGPVSVHTPDVCYGGAGFVLVAPANQETFAYDSAPAPAEFNVGHFRKVQAGLATHLRIFWTWNNDGVWRAPRNPRWTFASSRALYKLYVVHEMAKENEPLAEDPSLEFLRVLLPELQQRLFAAS